MAKFIGRVVVEQLSRWWMLQEPLAYLDEEKHIRIQVPAGFLTDFASIPRLFWNLAPPDDYEYSAAAVIHDRLYETHERPRREADAIFYDAMAVHGTPTWKRVVMWAAVRLFGGQAYASGPYRRAQRRLVRNLRLV